MWRAPVQMASSEYCGRVFHRILVVDLVLEFALHVGQSLDSSSGSVESLAGIDFLNLDDTPLPPAYGIDGMYTKPAVTDKPRHY